MAINYSLYEAAAGSSLGSAVATYVQTGSTTAAAGAFVGALVVSFGGLLGFHGVRTFVASLATGAASTPTPPTTP